MSVPANHFAAPPSVAVAQSAPRSLTVDLLRTAALLYVVGFWHLFEYADALNTHKNPVTSVFTHVCLGLFVFISGLVLAQRYEFPSRDRIWAFYRRRWLRIYPMYWLALTGFWLLQQIDGFTYLRATFLTTAFPFLPLTTLWFIPVIMTYYALTPIYLYRYQTQYRNQVAIAFTLILYAALLLVFFTTNAIDLRLVIYLPAFAYGIVLGQQANLRQVLLSKWGVWSCLSGFWVMTILYANLEFGLVHILVTDMAVGCAIPVLWCIADAIAAQLKHPLLLHWIQTISYASFAAYLIHRLTFHFGQIIYKPTTILASLLYWAGIMLPITFVIAYGFQKLYDRVVKAISRKE